MYTLRFHRESKEVEQIKEKLISISLAYKSEVTISEDRISLIDRDIIYSGFDEIMDHLHDLESELMKWYYCDC